MQTLPIRYEAHSVFDSLKKLIELIERPHHLSLKRSPHKTNVGEARRVEDAPSESTTAKATVVLQPSFSMRGTKPTEAETSYCTGILCRWM